MSPEGRLDEIPQHLGALQRGQRMQEKASRGGFDWANVEGILEKLVDELEELWTLAKAELRK